LGKNIAKINAQKSMTAPDAKIFIPALGPAPCQEDAGMALSPDLATRAFAITKYAPNTAKPINRRSTPPKRRTVTTIQVRCGIVMSFCLARRQRLEVLQRLVDVHCAEIAARGFLHLFQAHGLEYRVARIGQKSGQVSVQHGSCGGICWSGTKMRFSAWNSVMNSSSPA